MKQPMFGRPRPLNWQEPKYAEQVEKSQSMESRVEEYHRNGTPPTRRGAVNGAMPVLRPNQYAPGLNPPLVLKGDYDGPSMEEVAEVEKSRNEALDRAFSKALGIPKVPQPEQQQGTQPGMLGMQMPGQVPMPSMMNQQQPQMPGMPQQGMPGAPQPGMPQPQPQMVQPGMPGAQGAQPGAEQGKQQMQVPGMPAPGVGPKLPGADPMQSAQKLQQPGGMPAALAPEMPGQDSFSQFMNAQVAGASAEDAKSPMERAVDKFSGDMGAGGENPDQGKPQAPPQAGPDRDGPKPGMEFSQNGGEQDKSIEDMRVGDLPDEILMLIQDAMGGMNMDDGEEDDSFDEGGRFGGEESEGEDNDDSHEFGGDQGGDKPSFGMKPSAGSSTENESKGAPEMGRPTKPVGANAPLTNAGNQKTEVEETAFKSFFNLIEG